MVKHLKYSVTISSFLQVKFNLNFMYLAKVNRTIIFKIAYVSEQVNKL